MINIPVENAKNFKTLLKIRENYETLTGNEGKILELKNEKFVATSVQIQ